MHMLREREAVEPRSGPVKGAARRGFGRLRQERSGRWSAAYVGPDSQLHKAPATFDAKDDAVAWLSAERRLIDLDTWTTPEERRSVRKVSGQTVGDYADTWLANRKTAKGEPLKARTVADYRRYLDRHIIPALGALPMRSLTPARVAAWYEALDATTPTHRAHVYQLLRAISATAVDSKLLAVNPCNITGAGRVQRAKKVTPATIEDLASIAANMPDRLRLAVLLGGWCALRHGEIAELRRRDVDLKRGTIAVARGVTWPSVRDPETGKLVSEAVVGTPKSAAGIREVHIPPHILPDVKAHLDEFTGAGRDAMLFPSSTGKHIHPRAFGWQYHQARVKAGRPDLRFHDLRHTGAVLAAQTGATLAELMARLGHSTPGAAMRYQHAAADRDKTIAQALSRLAQQSVE